MTGYEVEPDYLHGYASQVRGNQHGSVRTLTGYAAQHCRNFDRISGIMEPVEWLSRPFADITVDKFLPTVASAFGWTADQLDATAVTYETAEKTVANRITSAMPGQGGGVSIESPFEFGQPARDPATLGFTDGADVAPKPPPDENLTTETVEKLNELLGEVTGIVKKFTGFDIIGEWAPVILGDSGAVRRLAGAWDEVGHSLRAIEADLKGGLDILAPHWIAGDESGAAKRFANHMNANMISGLGVYAELTDLVREWHEYLAINYEAIVVNAFWLIEYYGVRFKSVVKKIRKALSEVSLNPKTWIDLGDELLSIVEDYISFFKTTLDAIRKCVEQFCQFVKMAFEGVDASIQFFAWKLANS